MERQERTIAVGERTHDNEQEQRKKTVPATETLKKQEKHQKGIDKINTIKGREKQTRI